MSQPATPILSLRSVTKRYGRHVAVNDLSFDVNQGDIFGFLGPNGAGKSTTMYMVCGLVRPTAGQISLFGRAHTAGPEVRRPLGALLETPAFYGYLSGRKNLEILARIHGPLDKRRIDEVLDQTGLLNRAGDKVSAYSHGMKQRLGIAQALIHRPSLLLLDEPTNGLDPEGSAQVWQLLRRLARDENITVVISSHLLHEVEEGCNRIAVINQGILVACDQVKNLLFFSKEDHLLFFESEEQTAKALAVAQNHPGVEVVTSETPASTEPGMQNTIRVRLRTGLAGDLVAALAAAGAPPRAVVPQRKTLKQFFLELTRRQ